MKAFNTAAALWALLLFPAAAAAQVTAPATPNNNTHPGSIRGRVVLPDGRSVTEPIRVSLQQMRADKAIFYTDNEGQFYLSKVEAGLYNVEAEDDRERKYELGSERVEVFPDSPVIVTIYLKEKKVAAKERPASDTISAAELDERVPSAAAREFDRGSHAYKEGKFEEAVGHMRKALSIYPDFLKARNDLGTYLLAQGKLEEATDELEAAVKLAPRAFNPRLNLGIVLVRRHEFAAAVENLDLALALDAGSASAHLHAGLARLGLGEAARAEKELAAAYELGGAEYALAQYHLGQLYMDRGERARALKAFETYLHDKPNAANAEEVRRLIGLLR
jgi:tetratricopeptide (TPR) repeat protein